MLTGERKDRKQNYKILYIILYKYQIYSILYVNIY